MKEFVPISLDGYGTIKLRGLGITKVDGGYAIRVNLYGIKNAEGTFALPTSLPAMVNGVPLVYKVVGKIKKRPVPVPDGVVVILWISILFAVMAAIIIYFG